MSFAPRTIHFVSLGCAKNRVDSEILAGIAGAKGYEIVAEPDRAEVIVVNTCAFVESAREESVDVVLDMARYARDGRRLVIAGCMAQRYSETLSEDLPEVTHILGTSELESLRDILDETAERVLVREAAHYLQTPETPRFIEPSAVSAFLKIADGCSRKCAFCAIPGIRGRARSRPLEEVVREAEALIGAGIRELNLVAQDTSAYGRDLRDGTDLTALIQALDRLPGQYWIRLLYLYPDAVTLPLLDAIAKARRVVPYFDIPIQHADGAMLKRMRRGHGPAALKQLISQIRSRIPSASIRTTVLVGHPGETRPAFDTLLAFMAWAGFDHLGAFRYSDEEGTASFGTANPVSKRDAYNRFRKVMALQRRISRAKNRERIGRTVSVLVEGGADEMGFVQQGRHAGQAPDVDGRTYLVSSRARPGDLIEARVVRAGDFDIVAEQI
jgi:ribosomal protein S12 methylthiotransferase